LTLSACFRAAWARFVWFDNKGSSGLILPLLIKTKDSLTLRGLLKPPARLKSHKSVQARRLRASRPSFLFLLAGSALLAGLAGCAQQPGGGKRTSEFFPSSKYGPASQRVVNEGEPVPRGGGQYLVGKSYTVAGKRYTPSTMAVGQSQSGKASWYGAAFHGRKTANGEVYDMASITAAHPTMPLPSYARVTNRDNGRSIIVRVNDRGPYHGNRVMDLSSRAADALDYKRMGTANIKVDYLGPAGLAGSDDAILMATLRTDGRPATLDGVNPKSPIMVADVSPSSSSSAQSLSSQPGALEQAALALSALSKPTEAPANAAPVPSAFAASSTQAPSALASVTPTQSAAAPLPSLVGVKPALMPANPPLPPTRPFDLGTIPGANVPIAAPNLRFRQAMMR
jgi:rare lipoprotein A